MSNRRAARRRPGRRRPARRSSTGRVWAALFGIVVIAGIIAVIASRGENTSGTDAEVAESVAVDGSTLATFSTGGTDDAVGTRVPLVEGASFDGEPVTIGGGGPQVVVFLAHWCPHCQADVPEMVAAGKSPDWPDDLEVVGVATATDRNRDNYPPSAWLEREGWDWPVLVDDEDKTAAVTFGLSGFPYAVFVDADGRVALRTSGEIGGQAFLEAAGRLAGGEPLASPPEGGASQG